MTRLCLPCMGKCLHSANEWDASGSSNGKPEYWGRAPTWVAASFLLASDSCLAAMTANIKLGVIGESRETLHTVMGGYRQKVSCFSPNSFVMVNYKTFHLKHYIVFVKIGPPTGQITF